MSISQTSDEVLYCRRPGAIPISRLVSWRGGSCKDCITLVGIDWFDKPTASTPHYAELENRELSLDARRDSDYVRYYDALVANGHTTRNNGEVVTSGIERLSKYRDLYQTIAINHNIEPICVVAEADGRFRITDGQHRAAIALKMGHETIPAQIVGVDRRLDELLNRLYAEWPPNERTLYQPIEHPVVNDWKVVRSEDRLKFVESVASWSNMSVLDIGSYTGYFSRYLSRMGAQVTAVDTDTNRLTISRELDELFGTQVSYLHGDFRSFLAASRWDVILFLSVLHWILRNDGLPGVSHCLAAISRAAPVMILDAASDAEAKMQDVGWNHGIKLDRESIPRLVLRHSAFSRWRYLGSDTLKRDMFIFWRT